jgi:protein-S-isoprenylcysteine O-methyltransferase Ste14/membrane-associated phospholipid phosphatase
VNVSKLLYGFLFVIVVPVLLVLWAGATAVRLAVPGSGPVGAALLAAGIALVLASMITIIVRGKGLPMNAFPPPVYVHSGVYRLTPHPMYVGFSLSCFGAALFWQSASGFWMVAPVATLGCVALVLGFEHQDLKARFGDGIHRCVIALPRDSEQRPRLSERLSVYVLVLIPWVLAYEAFVAIGTPRDAIDAYLRFEQQIPVLQWTELIYGATYLFVALVPLVVPDARTLRRFSQTGIIATIVMVVCFLAFPVVAPPRDFIPQGLWGMLLAFERTHDTAAAAFPSYHVVWAVIAAQTLAASFPRRKGVWWLIAVLIGVSCVTTGMHAILDVVAGAITGLLVVRHRRVWEWIRLSSEHVANSWKEWHIGKSIRLINHGGYAAAGTTCAILITGTLLGSRQLGYILLIACTSVVTAGLWAQIIEGSPSLLRPYGYYGGVVGVVLGGVLAFLIGGDIWSLLGAFGVAGPAVQAWGRLRCLVQGCCHGRETRGYIGIRYTHPRSRVCRLSNLGGIPVHPAPVYSILWNVVAGVFLLRLWMLGTEPAMIAGLYLILNGLGRFVEEAYRGEPQTPMLGKLRLYQVMSIISVIAGAVLTAVPSHPATVRPAVEPVTVVAALVFGFMTWLAMGVDFPNSNKRFARLV